MMTSEQFTRIAKALADPRRFEILEMIAAAEEVACKAMVEAFPVAQATISHHLKELATAGLIEARRYFAWKEIPLVILIGARIDDPADGSGLYVVSGERRWPLGPLLGTRLSAVANNRDGWWWAPQLG